MWCPHILIKVTVSDLRKDEAQSIAFVFRDRKMHVDLRRMTQARKEV